MRRAFTFEELYDLMSHLHDCLFELDDATFEEVTGTWSGTFFRPIWEDPAAEHRRLKLVFSRSEFPVAKVSVSIRKVREVQVNDDQGIGRYALNEVERTEDGMRIRFNEALRIDLRLAAGIEATYDERPLPGVRAVYRRFLSIESGPGIETLPEGG